MKTYLLDTFNRYKKFSQNLDVKTVLCSKSWYVFNDEDEKQLYIFQRDGSVLVTTNGVGSLLSWKYLSTNNSILLYSNKDNFIMLRTAFIDGDILAFQLDGTNRYTFLIEENKLKTFYPKTLTQLNQYFYEKEHKVEQEKLLIEKQKRIEKTKSEIRKKREERDRADYSKALSVRRTIANNIDRKFHSYKGYSFILYFLSLVSFCIIIKYNAVLLAFIPLFFLFLGSFYDMKYNKKIKEEKNKYMKQYPNETWTKYL